VLGRYDPKDAVIRIHAYLGEPDAVAPFALYLKMLTLTVLVHEAGHHFDDMFRSSRSRWDVRDRESHEAYAMAEEREHSISIVAPYVYETYGRELRELEDWVALHSGVKILGLGLTEGPGYELDLAIAALARSLHEGRNKDDVRVEFARALHRMGSNEEAAKIVAEVLEKDPDHALALAVQACIAACGERDFDRAESTCRRALARDPQCVDAWETLVRCFAIRESWGEAAVACEQGLASSRDPSLRVLHYMLETRVEARLLLGERAGVEAALAKMREAGLALEADVYAVVDLCWREEWSEAHTLASRLLATGRYARDLWLAAVKFESAHRLKKAHLAGVFDVRELARSQPEPFTRAWAARIGALISA
jgi:tetratricopeptide (TPR) repeat protein